MHIQKSANPMRCTMAETYISQVNTGGQRILLPIVKAICPEGFTSEYITDTISFLQSRGVEELTGRNLLFPGETRQYRVLCAH